MTRRLSRQLACLGVLLTIGCGASPADVPDRTAMRVVSLVPAATEMLFDVGAGDDVIGVSSFDRYPPDVISRPKVGALVDPDFERILTLRPTLVVVYGSQEELIARLSRASIPVFRYRHAIEDGLADVPRTMRELGNRVGRGPTARAAADRLEQELNTVRASVAGRPRPATALVFGREPGALRGIYVSGGVGFLHDLLEAAGGRNVFEDVRRESLQASTELFLTRSPEVIIELRSSSLEADAVETERAVWNRLASVPAVRQHRVHILTDDSLSIPGPRIGAAARALRALLHPDAGE